MTCLKEEFHSREKKLFTIHTFCLNGPSNSNINFFFLKLVIKTKTDDIKEINNFYVNKIGKNIMIKKKTSRFN